MTLAPPDPFPFEVYDNDEGMRLGDQCWMVVLPDRREAHLFAGDVTVSDTGVLRVWRTNAANEDGYACGERLAEPELLLAIAPGGWVSVYAASVFDTAPVAVGHVGPPRSS